MQTGGYTLIALGFAMMLVAVLPMDEPPRRSSRSRRLRRVGTYSYGMYVFHAPLHLISALPLLERIAPTYGSAVGLLYAVRRHARDVRGGGGVVSSVRAVVPVAEEGARALKRDGGRRRSRTARR